VGLAILGAALESSLWPTAVAIIAVRMVLAMIQARMLPIQRGWWLAGSVPFLESFFWLMAWFPVPVWWAGRWRRTTLRGRLVDPTVPTPR
jgi:hypothetical protein